MNNAEIIFLRPVMQFFESVGNHTLFFAQTVKWIFKPPFDTKNILLQMLEIGYKSLPVTCITLFFYGDGNGIADWQGNGLAHVRFINIYW